MEAPHTAGRLERSGDTIVATPFVDGSLDADEIANGTRTLHKRVEGGDAKVILRYYSLFKPTEEIKNPLIIYKGADTRVLGQLAVVWAQPTAPDIKVAFIQLGKRKIKSPRWSPYPPYVPPGPLHKGFAVDTTPERYAAKIPFCDPTLIVPALNRSAIMLDGPGLKLEALTMGRYDARYEFHTWAIYHTGEKDAEGVMYRYLAGVVVWPFRRVIELWPVWPFIHRNYIKVRAVESKAYTPTLKEYRCPYKPLLSEVNWRRDQKGRPEWLPYPENPQ